MACNLNQPFPESQKNYTFPQYDQSQRTMQPTMPSAGSYVRNLQGRMPAQSAVTGSMQTMPTAPQTTAGMPLVPSAASETPTTVQSPYYTAGFLRNFLGKNMRVEFLIGTSGALVDRVGVLVEVGASYIVLQPYMTDDLLMCDLYSIKFVTIFG